MFIHGKNYAYINTPWGYWYLVEVVGFVLIPCIIFLIGFRHFNINLVRIAAALSIIGIILNRLNISSIAYHWYDAFHYPTWMEIEGSIAVVIAQLLVFRWIVRRMPVYTESPKWVNEKKKNNLFNNNEKRRKKWKGSAA